MEVPDLFALASKKLSSLIKQLNQLSILYKVEWKSTIFFKTSGEPRFSRVEASKLFLFAVEKNPVLLR